MVGRESDWASTNLSLDVDCVGTLNLFIFYMYFLHQLARLDVSFEALSPFIRPL
ncbi:hypothetical protein RhiirA5_437778 [Rhizophagus irregularis]|uniref:Uncharacterized protein n=1 Tax=Rhizophagus irregularis TaxID=588596 RepID=A0A2N0NK33_9GLOM|nr:hypothetical protein RhiirA5_437778 [Rhizophagus irregularis]